MVDNITLKCYDKEVYHHLRYGTFVEKSNWINGRWYDKLVLNNGKYGDDAHDLIIEFYEDFMKIYGSIRNGFGEGLAESGQTTWHLVRYVENL